MKCRLRVVPCLVRPSCVTDFFRIMYDRINERGTTRNRNGMCYFLDGESWDGGGGEGEGGGLKGLTSSFSSHLASHADTLWARHAIIHRIFLAIAQRVSELEATSYSQKDISFIFNLTTRVRLLKETRLIEGQGLRFPVLLTHSPVTTIPHRHCCFPQSVHNVPL